MNTLYPWVSAKDGLIREWFTDAQKTQERTPFVPEDHEWVALDPPQARLRLAYDIDGPTQRWRIGSDGVVVVEDIP